MGDIHKMDSAGKIGKELARVYDARTQSPPQQFNDDQNWNGKSAEELALYNLKKMDYETAVYTVGAAVHDVRFFRHAKYMLFLLAGIALGSIGTCKEMKSQMKQRTGNGIELMKQTSTMPKPTP